MLFLTCTWIEKGWKSLKASVKPIWFVRTIYILIGTMVRKESKAIWTKFLSIPSFLDNENSQALIEQGIYKDCTCSYEHL